MDDQNQAQQAEGQQMVLVVQPAPPDEENKVAMLEMAGLFFVAAVAIFCARRLLDLFRVDHD